MKTSDIHPALVAGLCSFALSTFADTISEDFSTAPPERNWKIVGDSTLFNWDTNRQALEVTWDSLRENSYFALPLGRTLGRNDDVSFAFDLSLTGFVAGISPEAPNPFQISVALVNLSRASGTNFLRGTGADSPDLVEFSFFPDPGGAWQWGPSLTAALTDSTGTNWSTGGFAPLALDSNTVYRVSLRYTASSQVLSAVINRGNQEFAVLSEGKPVASFTDFAVDHFAICSYSGAGQFPAYAGSIWARGTIDNVTITTPEALAIRMISFLTTRTELRLQGQAGWIYSLERSTDLFTWTSLSGAETGSNAEMSLIDTNPPPERAFYRVKAAPGP
jgi:hypothetical protein